MTSLVLIPPVPVTDAVLTSSNVAETDYAAWNAATSYVVGDRVIRTASGVHKIFENLIAGIDATNPESAPTRWIAVSPTNRWKMFDTSNTTTTSAASPVSIVLLPGQAVNAVALVGLVSSTVRVRMTDPTAGTVYDVTTTTGGVITAPDWYAYFFSTVRPVSAFSALDLPAYPACSVLIDITNATANVQCATCVVGYHYEIGLGVQYGAKVGITDYSVKTANTFGDYVLTQRAYSKRATFDMMIAKNEVDVVGELLAAYRATPCMWIGSDEYTSTQLFGFYKDFSTVISYPYHSLLSLEIEGMT